MFVKTKAGQTPSSSGGSHHGHHGHGHGHGHGAHSTHSTHSTHGTRGNSGGSNSSNTNHRTSKYLDPLQEAYKLKQQIDAVQQTEKSFKHSEVIQLQSKLLNRGWKWISKYGIEYCHKYNKMKKTVQNYEELIKLIATMNNNVLNVSQSLNHNMSIVNKKIDRNTSYLDTYNNYIKTENIELLALLKANQNQNQNRYRIPSNDMYTNTSTNHHSNHKHHLPYARSSDSSNSSSSNNDGDSDSESDGDGDGDGDGDNSLMDDEKEGEAEPDSKHTNPGDANNVQVQKKMKNHRNDNHEQLRHNRTFDSEVMFGLSDMNTSLMTIHKQPLSPTPYIVDDKDGDAEGDGNRDAGEEAKADGKQRVVNSGGGEDVSVELPASSKTDEQKAKSKPVSDDVDSKTDARAKVNANTAAIANNIDNDNCDEGAHANDEDFDEDENGGNLRLRGDTTYNVFSSADRHRSEHSGVLYNNHNNTNGDGGSNRFRDGSFGSDGRPVSAQQQYTHHANDISIIPMDLMLGNSGRDFTENWTKNNFNKRQQLLQQQQQQQQQSQAQKTLSSLFTYDSGGNNVNAGGSPSNNATAVKDFAMSKKENLIFETILEKMSDLESTNNKFEQFIACDVKKCHVTVKSKIRAKIQIFRDIINQREMGLYNDLKYKHKEKLVQIQRQKKDIQKSKKFLKMQLVQCEKIKQEYHTKWNTEYDAWMQLHDSNYTRKNSSGDVKNGTHHSDSKDANVANVTAVASLLTNQPVSPQQSIHLISNKLFGTSVDRKLLNTKQSLMKERQQRLLSILQSITKLTSMKKMNKNIQQIEQMYMFMIEASEMYELQQKLTNVGQIIDFANPPKNNSNILAWKLRKPTATTNASSHHSNVSYNNTNNHHNHGNNGSNNMNNGNNSHHHNSSTTIFMLNNNAGGHTQTHGVGHMSSTEKSNRNAFGNLFQWNALLGGGKKRVSTMGDALNMHMSASANANDSTNMRLDDCVSINALSINSESGSDAEQENNKKAKKCKHHNTSAENNQHDNKPISDQTLPSHSLTNIEESRRRRSSGDIHSHNASTNHTKSRTKKKKKKKKRTIVLNENTSVIDDNTNTHLNANDNDMQAPAKERKLKSIDCIVSDIQKKQKDVVIANDNENSCDADIGSTLSSQQTMLDLP